MGPSARSSAADSVYLGPAVRAGSSGSASLQSPAARAERSAALSA
jgi:hypothetical protein